MLGKAADLNCSKGGAVMFETVKKLYAEGKLPDLDYCIYYKKKILFTSTAVENATASGRFGPNCGKILLISLSRER